MESTEFTAAWLKNYQTAPSQLSKISNVNGLISAFNANIDAVIKVSGSMIESLIAEHNLSVDAILSPGERKIESSEDAIRGLVHCFSGGIAEEWLIRDRLVFEWLHTHVGYDKLQMGGQGGIVANVMAVCGVQSVYVHCAAIPKEQAGLFLDLENLKTTDHEGHLGKAHTTHREDDIPLIHWIIEFDKGDQIRLADQVIKCPKSNRFIATYDPLNFRLAIDPYFAHEMAKPEVKLDYVVLSGFQMLQETLADGETGAERIDRAIRVINRWKECHPDAILHLEMASTQDQAMRKYLLDTLAQKVDSLGFNERELIDLLEVMGETELAEACDASTDAVHLFQGMQKLRAYTRCPRVQLHMFGLYLTLQDTDFVITAEQNRNGMQLAAVIAAAKAGTGSIHDKAVLLWAKDRAVSKQGLNEMVALDTLLGGSGGGDFLSTGIAQIEATTVIAVPSILIDQPVTLVGMGDTISSISLVGAQ